VDSRDTAHYRSGGGNSEFPRILFPFSGFLCVSFAPLRLCGED
jgi:hypothetical protein